MAIIQGQPDSPFQRLEVPQDCILGHFQPSLRDWVVSQTYPGLTSWATLSRPFGTEFGEGSSHARSKPSSLKSSTARLKPFPDTKHEFSVARKAVSYTTSGCPAVCKGRTSVADGGLGQKFANKAN
jgi:hypothetical protein